jgi:hypothetical protein
MNRHTSRGGFSTTPVGGDRAVLFADGNVTDLHFAGKANAINDAGTIVGTGILTPIDQSFAHRTLVRSLTQRGWRGTLFSERVCGMRTRRRGEHSQPGG